MGSEESHFNISLIVRDKVTRQCPQTTVCEEKGEPKRIRTEVHLLTSLTLYRLGQTGQSVSFTVPTVQAVSFAVPTEEKEKQ